MTIFTSYFELCVIIFPCNSFVIIMIFQHAICNRFDCTTVFSSNIWLFDYLILCTAKQVQMFEFDYLIIWSYAQQTGSNVQISLTWIFDYLILLKWNTAGFFNPMCCPTSYWSGLGSNCLVDQRIVEAPTKTSSYNAVLEATQRIRSKTARIVSRTRKYDVFGVGGLPFYVLELFYITLGTVRIDLHYWPARFFTEEWLKWEEDNTYMLLWITCNYLPV